VSRRDVIDRSIAHFQKADPEYGRRVAEAVAERRKAAAGDGGAR
jgi:catalase